MTLPVTFDHCVIHVGDWTRSTAFYRDVLGAEPVPVGKGFAYRFGAVQLNCHGPDQIGEPRARLPAPVQLTSGDRRRRSKDSGGRSRAK